jgi:hypothetical protein
MGDLVTDLRRTVRSIFNIAKGALDMSGLTLARTFTFPNKSGTIALTSDIDTSLWTRIGLASDFTNSTVTFNTITGFTFTPPANTNFTIEAEILLTTAATASLPELRVSIGAGQAYGAASLTYQSGAAAQVRAEGQFTTGATTIAMPAGTAPLATNPYLATVVVKGRSGASPGAITIDLAAETASNQAAAKVGSEMRYRTGP